MGPDSFLHSGQNIFPWSYIFTYLVPPASHACPLGFLPALGAYCPLVQAATGMLCPWALGF